MDIDDQDDVDDGETKKERLKYWRESDAQNTREAALRIVVNLYKSNARKASETTFASDKLIGDLVTDARYVERFIKGEI